MPGFGDAVRRIGSTQWFAAVGKRVASPIDRAIIRVFGGRFRTSDRGPVPTLLLTNVGRRTGREHRTPVLFVRDGDRLVVAGSNWGQAHDPAWALNLVANPRARVQIGRERFEVVARVTSGEERERLWRRLLEVWPAYETYATRSGGREIKVFVLERA